MIAKIFDIIAKEQFNFLESEYNFRLSKCDKKDWGYEIVYLNNTTGVKIIHEYRESYIFILLYRLVNEKLIEASGNIKEDTILHSYGLDDIVNLHNPSALISPTYEYPDASKFHDQHKGMSLYVSAFADNLKTYAKDVLIGNFEIFPELDKVVKERVRNYK